MNNCFLVLGVHILLTQFPYAELKMPNMTQKRDSDTCYVSDSLISSFSYFIKT